MSFAWNPSSDEEDLDEWTRREGFQRDTSILSAADPVNRDDIRENASTFVSTDAWEQMGRSPAGLPTSLTLDSSDEEEEVDWEDVADGNGDLKPAAVTASHQPVTTNKSVMIDLSKKTPDVSPVIESKRKARTRKRFRNESLPQYLQTLLRDLHRTSLLFLASRAIYLSKLTTNDEFLAVAHSLVPLSLLHQLTSTDTVHSSRETIPPTRHDLRTFCDWYFAFVHNVDSRRRQQLAAHHAAGAPTATIRRVRQPRGKASKAHSNQVRHVDANPIKMLSSSNGDDPSDCSLLEYAAYVALSDHGDPQAQTVWRKRDVEFSERHPTLLLLAIARSLGWRARLVQAMNPIRSDLDVAHPILTCSQNIFVTLSHNLQHQSPRSAASKRKRASTTPELQTEVTPVGMSSSISQRNVTADWVEILIQDGSTRSGFRWIHVDPVQELINRPDQIERRLAAIFSLVEGQATRKRVALGYAVAVEHAVDGVAPVVESATGQFQITDVTPRYASSWVESLRVRGLVRGKNSLTEKNLKKSWWSITLAKLNTSCVSIYPELDQRAGGSPADAIVVDQDSGDNLSSLVSSRPKVMATMEDHESEELQQSVENEAIPTSKAAFKTHPIYALQSVLNSTDVLAPDAGLRICGVFKGELIYRRSDVSSALPEKKWLYQDRKVRQGEQPIKRVKARRKTTPTKAFQALTSYGVGSSNDGSEERRAADIAQGSQPLDDGMVDLFAIWQTDPWSPIPIGPNDAIPVNIYNNIELELLNPGLVHIDQRGASIVAKKLGISYAPCLLGFEGHGSNRTPTIRGIVVHAHNEQIVREAHVEATSHQMQVDEDNRRHAALLRWKKLMVGILTKDRLERDYT